MSNSESRFHHWWPVGLQKYWRDESERVHWVTPQGDPLSAPSSQRDRSIGGTVAGHSMLEGTPWKTNFESDFDIDRRVHQIVKTVLSTRPEWHLNSRDLKWERDWNSVALFALSLLVRCPAKRSGLEQFPHLVGMPSDDEIGTANIQSLYSRAMEHIEGDLSNLTLTFLHSRGENFQTGDGFHDRVTSSLNCNAISGRAFVPLVPKVGLYLTGKPRFTDARESERGKRMRLKSVYVEDWLVREANELTQLCSKNLLFFKGLAPKVTENFKRNEFLCTADGEHEFIRTVSRLVGA